MILNHLTPYQDHSSGLTVAKLKLDQELKRASAALRSGNAPAAREIYRALLAVFPGNKHVRQALAEIDQRLAPPGVACDPPRDVIDALIGLFNGGHFDDVVARAQSSVKEYPGSFFLWNILGASSAQSNRLDLALTAFDKACAINPAAAEAHYNVALVLTEQGHLDEAVAAYQRALSIKPDYSAAHNNLGNVFNAQGRLEEAAASYRRALALDPRNAEAHNNLGFVFNELGDLQASAVSYRRALAIRPDFAEAEAQMLRQQLQICDWRDFGHLPSACNRLAAHRDCPEPNQFLTMVDDAAIQLRISRKWASAKYIHAPLPMPAKPEGRRERVRVGYLSADFHDHATLFLMAGMLRDHDRTQFEIHAYSYGRHQSGIWGERARRDVDHFFDIADQPSRAIVDLVRSHDLDIAIDLKGYTGHGRFDLFQYRLAPIQVSYLGYPGTTGADFIDYMVVDPMVVPADQRPFYSERMIYLPHSYQPNDNSREIAKTDTSRADFGLPESGFVFCCFNNNYKIGPREFDIWMRLLGQVEGSVLWLFKANRWSEANLRKEAAARGIAPERLVFAPFANHAQHLARHKHADLFIDTFNVNAHTTSSDALWAGLPVVTKAGRQFAARVSASLLNAVGLPELITDTDAAYEALILDLATNPQRLADIKTRLAQNRADHPLFDTRRYTRNFEAGLQRAYEQYIAGLPPQDIRVSE